MPYFIALLIMKKLLSTVLITAVLSFPIALFNPYQAAGLSSVSDLITDSRPSTDSNHTITFTTTTLVNDTASDTVVVTFPAGFDLTGVTEDDLDLEDDGADKTTAATCAGTEHFSAAISGQVITFTACTGDNGDIAAGSVVTVKIGTNAAGSGTGANRINNHATPSTYTIGLASATADTGNALIAVIATVTASVTIGETLTVAVTGDDSITCPTVANSGATAPSTAIAIPYGNVNANTFYDGCQRVEVSTNAAGGYSATLIMTDQLSTGTNEIADGDCDGGCSDTTQAAWATNTNDGFGYCLQDVGTGTDMNDDFNGVDCNDTPPNFKTIPDVASLGTPEMIMTNTGLVSGSQVYVSYRLSVGATQPAGTYTNNLIYVATPIY